jgi:pimeloyl-ACP methyl ester carboxylesterase
MQPVYNRPVEVLERTDEIAGLRIHSRRAGERPVLYVHGVPTASWDWLPFLERIGGVAPDLPGFGSSGKPADFDYSIPGYERFLAEFVDAAGLERFSLVMHDWGSLGLALAQSMPERIERLVLFNVVPFVPGYRWHRIARIWRTRGAGELLMGASTRFGFKQLSRESNHRPGPMPDEFIERIWADFDHGTQRAILRLYRSAPPEALQRAGERLGDLRCPALVLWPTEDPYLGVEFGRRHADALGGPAMLELVECSGHWPWVDRPELVERVAGFLL